MKNINQAAQRKEDKSDSINRRIQQLLHQSARERVTILRWNRSSLILVYVILVIVIILTLIEVDHIITGLSSVFGLALVWLSSWLRERKLENNFYEEEAHNYAEPPVGESLNKSDETEAYNSFRLAESTLTLREIEILEQMAQGRTNKEIAYKLQISPQTVKNHIAHIFWKLDVGDRTSAVLFAMHNGWVKDYHTDLSLPIDKNRVPRMVK